MKQRISILIIIFILFSIPAWAIYQSSTFGNRSGSAAVGESNLVLAGDQTDRSAGTDVEQQAITNLVYIHAGGVGFDGTAGTLRYGYLRTGANITATNIKMVVYTLSGGTWSSLEVSSGTAFLANSLMVFTFSGTNQIPAGTGNIQIGWIADGYCYTKRSGTTWQQFVNNGGSYATPPTSIDPDTDTNLSGAQQECYVTNYLQ